MPIQSGDLVFQAIWPANTTPQAVDGVGASPRSLCGWIFQNAAASVRFVRFFDTAVAPTMGTTSPRFVVPLALTSSGVPVFLPRPILFTAGLWVSVTNLQANLDNTAPTAGDVLMDLFWQ